jgi:hypothetical protein
MAIGTYFFFLSFFLHGRFGETPVIVFLEWAWADFLSEPGVLVSADVHRAYSLCGYERIWAI